MVKQPKKTTEVNEGSEGNWRSENEINEKTGNPEKSVTQ